MTLQEGTALVDVIDSPPAKTSRSIRGTGKAGDIAAAAWSPGW